MLFQIDRKSQALISMLCINASTFDYFKRVCEGIKSTLSRSRALAIIRIGREKTRPCIKPDGCGTPPRGVPNRVQSSNEAGRFTNPAVYGKSRLFRHRRLFITMNWFIDEACQSIDTKDALHCIFNVICMIPICKMEPSSLRRGIPGSRILLRRWVSLLD